MPSVLLFGATGLVGGSLPIGCRYPNLTVSLTRFTARLAADIKRSHPDWALTAFFRNSFADEYFRSTARVDRIVHGSFSDTELVRTLSKEHDIVVNAASSFDGDFVNVIISGMEEHPASNTGTLIHLSGTGNFIDFGTTGNFNPKSKVWNVSSSSS